MGPWLQAGPRRRCERVHIGHAFGRDALLGALREMYDESDYMTASGYGAVAMLVATGGKTN